MIRIGVNLQALRPGEIGGLEGYVRNVLRHITELHRDVEFVLFCTDYNQESFAGQPVIETRLLSPSEFAELGPDRLLGCGLDLWFCPLLVLEPAEPGLPSVVTIPDLQHEEYPEFFTPEVLAWRRTHYRRSAHAADRVLTISEYSKRHIVDRLSVEPDAVAAVHLDASTVFSHGGAENCVNSVRAEYGLPDRFFYYPANTWEHKNHRVLFESLARYRDEVGDCPGLVLTGAKIEQAGGWDRPVKELGLVDRVLHLGYLPENDLPGLYASCLALVMPSLFEGFCIPVVEAMRCGCPVLCSSTTSLPEVCGEAALYFDPRRPQDLAEKMLALTGEGENTGTVDRQELISKGHRRAQDFSWERTANSTLQVFQEVFDSKPAIEINPGTRDVPPITVITPSYQQGEFIERTLRSVLEQGYPRLQYLVIDGGSTDQTVEILEHYRSRFPQTLSYVSEPDRGQAHAVNKGLARAEGEIIGWLNSDDTYAPGSLQATADAFVERPECDVIYGRARYISSDDRDLGPYPTRSSFDPATLADECYLCQPAVFFRRSSVGEGPVLDESLQTCMDYDLWIRLGRVARFSFLDRHLASSRMYPANKTMGRRTTVYDEIISVVKRHYGRLPPSWALGRATHEVDAGDPIFGDPTPSRLARLFAVWLLLRHNRPHKKLWSDVSSVAATLTPRFTPHRLRIPRSQPVVAVPNSWLACHLEFTVSDRAGLEPSGVVVWASEKKLARVPVEGPGTYSQVVALPPGPPEGRTRLQLRCEGGLRGRNLRVSEPQPCLLAAADRWLQKRDTLRIPPEWNVIDLAFMLPDTGNPPVELRFEQGGEVVESWLLAKPGEHRRRLTLPAGTPSDERMVNLEFHSSAAVPANPESGEFRELAVLLREVVPIQTSNTADQ